MAAAFQFRFMALAIDVIDRCDLSNETSCQLQPKKTKVRVYYPFTYIAAKDVLAALYY